MPVFTIKSQHSLALAVVIVLGVLVRVYGFPNVPPGLNPDEASAGYDAYSLLLTGKDKWGNPWPIYFLASGTGQNVLYSYLAMPIINFFGLNPLTTRLVNLIFGILTLPILYITTRQIFGKRVALISTFLLAVLPWHIMISRWGLESHLLSFFLLLGTYTLRQALVNNSLTLLIILAFVPWAISLYAYATSYILVPLLIILVLFTYRKICWDNNKWKWLVSLLIFLILVFPLILFIIKNFWTHSDFGFESSLPVTIPLLPATRLSQVSTSWNKMIYKNLIFILNGFQDNLIWNSVDTFAPIFMIQFPFLAVGTLISIRKFFTDYKINIFILWLFCCLPLVFTAVLNTTRANAFFIPIIVISSVGFVEILDSLSSYLKKMTAYATAGLILLNSLLFSHSYFKIYPNLERVAYSFNNGLEETLIEAEKIALPSEKIFISELIPLRYIYILFYLKIPPQKFQSNSHYIFIGDRYFVSSFDRFYFDFRSLEMSGYGSFIYVLRNPEQEVCKAPKLIYKTKLWKVGRCLSRHAS